MNCTNCGNALRPGDQFCLKCGGPAPPSNVEPSGAPASPPLPEDNKPPQPAQAYPPQSKQAPPPQPAQGYPTQQPQTYPPSAAQNQTRTLLGLAMVFSLIGGIMLMVLEFGGWYNYNDYYHTREWGWVGPLENPLSFLPFLAVAGSLFYCSFIAYQEFSSKEALKRSLIMRGFVISLIVFIIIIIGGATLIILTIENDSQWLSAGFYGGAIGSFLTAILFWLVLKNIPHTKVDRRAGYGGRSYGTQSTAQYPYPQTQAPQPTQPTGPSSEPEPETAQEPQVTEPEETEEPIPQEESQPAEGEEPTPQEEPQPEAQQLTQEPQPAQQQFQQPQQQQYQQPYYPQYQQQPQQQTYPCRTCGRPLRYVPEYRRWYCDTCRQYA